MDDLWVQNVTARLVLLPLQWIVRRRGDFKRRRREKDPPSWSIEAPERILRNLRINLGDIMPNPNDFWAPVIVMYRRKCHVQEDDISGIYGMYSEWSYSGVTREKCLYMCIFLEQDIVRAQ